MTILYALVLFAVLADRVVLSFMPILGVPIVLTTLVIVWITPKTKSEDLLRLSFVAAVASSLIWAGSSFYSFVFFLALGVFVYFAKESTHLFGSYGKKIVSMSLLSQVAVLSGVGFVYYGSAILGFTDTYSIEHISRYVVIGVLLNLVIGLPGYRLVKIHEKNQ